MEHFVKLGKLINEQGLELVWGKDGYEEIPITVAEINRPSLQIAGFFDYFDPRRIQVFGKVEYTYLKDMEEAERRKRFDQLFEKGIPALVVTHDLPIYPELLESAKEHEITVLHTAEGTSRFMSALILSLSVWLAPVTTMHGVWLRCMAKVCSSPVKVVLVKVKLPLSL